jgi:two-component system, NarL family, sensor histidine kinase FusK
MPKGPGSAGSLIGLQHVALAVGYALVYCLLRQLSFSHWALFAGLRLGALLLVPYRYWPALAVGEMGVLGWHSADCADEYGWVWGAAYMVPPMLFAMPLVRWARARRRLFPSRSTTNVNVMLLCILVASAVWTAISLVTLSLMRGPQTVDLPYRMAAGWYFIGNYIGLLTVVPVTLLLREQWLSIGWRRMGPALAHSRLALETACVLLPSLALLAWLAAGAAGPASQEARIGMFLPVAWLALRHGWRGAAVGGTAASIAVVLTMPALRDLGTLHAQVFVSFTVTTMLLLGGRIASLHERETRERNDVRFAYAAAQRTIGLGEMQLRQTSSAVEQMNNLIQASYAQMLDRMRHLAPGTDERNYYRQAAATQHRMYRLADSLYPLAWQERGLPAALREGSMPRALDEAGVAYGCEVRDRGLDGLSTSVQLTLYRLACEAIAVACAMRNVSGIHLRLRAGSFGGRRWALLCVDSEVDYERLSRVRWDDLLPTLGGSGLGLCAIKDRAAIFEGKVRTRSRRAGNRISILLFDPDPA